MTPELSVIVPCRNGADFLDAALGSILPQLTLPAELILVNDGSTDASADIARARGGIVRVLDIPPSGLAAARWTGIQASTGRLLAFCDADDLWPADRIHGQMAFMTEQGCAVSCGLSQNFLSEDLHQGPEDRALAEPQYYRTFSTLMTTRAVMERVGPLPLDGADLTLPFFAALDDAGIAVARYPQVASLRRVHRSNFSRQGGPRFTEYARSIKAILDRRRSGGRPDGAPDGQPCSDA